MHAGIIAVIIFARERWLAERRWRPGCAIISGFVAYHTCRLKRRIITRDIVSFIRQSTWRYIPVAHLHRLSIFTVCLTVQVHLIPLSLSLSLPRVTESRIIETTLNNFIDECNGYVTPRPREGRAARRRDTGKRSLRGLEKYSYDRSIDRSISGPDLRACMRVYPSILQAGTRRAVPAAAEPSRSRSRRFAGLYVSLREDRYLY